MNSPGRRPPYLVERGSGYIEYQLPISLKLVIDYQGKVPLLKNERDEWELPGGKLEMGESPEECVSQEVAEELGLTVSDATIIGSWVYQITSLRHVFIVNYGAVDDGTKELQHSAEHKELGVFSYNIIDQLAMPAGYKRAIAAWRAWLNRFE